MNESVAKEIMGRYSHNSTMALNNPRRGGGFDIAPRSTYLKKYSNTKIKKMLAEEAAQGKSLGYKDGAATMKWRKKQMKMHNRLIRTAESYVGKQVKGHQHFCAVTDRIYELGRKYRELDEERRRKKAIKFHKEETARLKTVIPNLNQGNEWNDAYYRHCKRLNVMTHVDDPWLPESEKHVIENQLWKKKGKRHRRPSSDRKLSSKNSTMAERLIGNTLFYSPSLFSNTNRKSIERTPSLMYLEDFMDEGLGGMWPKDNNNITSKAPYNKLVKRSEAESRAKKQLAETV